MNYFLNENIFTLNSGTEFSAVKRVQLFHANGIPAKILTRNYSAQLFGDAKRAELAQEDYLNMYDFFQEVVGVTGEDTDVRYTEAIDKYTYHIEGVDADHSLVKHAGKTIAKVVIAPATVGLVGSIEYYNDMSGVSAKDVWDRRGFKSSTQYFHPDGSEGPQIFYDLNGQPKIEVVRMNINGKLFPTMYRLLDYKGRVWRFDNEDQMFVFFLNELAAKEPSVFIADRPSLTPALAAVQGAKGKWQYLHNTHAANNNEIGAPRQVAGYLKPLFDTFSSQLDGILVPTEHQQKDLQVFKTKFKQILAVPDTFAEEIELDKEKHDKNKIIFLGRLAVDKGVSDAVRIFANIHQKLPEAKLHFYGYASPLSIQEDVEKLAESEHVKDSLVFHGYLPEETLTKELKTAGLLLNTSSGESFGMTILQAMNVGVPVVGYTVKYGLREQIEQGVNGALVPRGATQKAADAALTILKQDEKSYENYSKAARAKAKELDEASAWSKWTAAHAVAENLFVK